MKKQFLNLGKALNRAEQKQIFGGVSDEIDRCMNSGEVCVKNGGANAECCEGLTCKGGHVFGICE